MSQVDIIQYVVLGAYVIFYVCMQIRLHRLNKEEKRLWGRA